MTKDRAHSVDACFEIHSVTDGAYGASSAYGVAPGKRSRGHTGRSGALLALAGL